MAVAVNSSKPVKPNKTDAPVESKQKSAKQ